MLAAAIEVLTDRGYERLTMDQVVARAGVGKASVYLRWPNKAALVADALRRLAPVAPEVPDTGRLSTDMTSFLTGLLHGKATAVRTIAAVRGEIHASPELHRAWREVLTATITDGLRAIVSRAVDRGELPSSTDVGLLAMVPLALLQSWRTEQGAAPDAAAIRRIVEQFFTPSRPPRRRRS